MSLKRQGKNLSDWNPSLRIPKAGCSLDRQSTRHPAHELTGDISPRRHGPAGRPSTSTEGQASPPSFLSRTRPPARWDPYASAKIGDAKYDVDLGCLDSRNGEIEYHWRETGSEQPPHKIVIREGQCFFTPPMVDHAMVFSQDTTFLTLGRNPRDQKSYEADVERIDLV